MISNVRKEHLFGTNNSNVIVMALYFNSSFIGIYKQKVQMFFDCISINKTVVFDPIEPLCYQKGLCSRS